MVILDKVILPSVLMRYGREMGRDNVGTYILYCMAEWMGKRWGYVWRVSSDGSKTRGGD